MRSLAALVVAAAALAGCTSGFPAGSRVLAEAEVGPLAAGEGSEAPFDVAGEGFLVAGFRVGRAEHVHATLRAPDGARYDLEAGSPPQPCSVQAAPGAWLLEVRADPFDGSLAGGKFTVRLASDAPPALFPCADDVFPGRARNVSLATWELNLSAGEAFDGAFEQPFDLEALQVAWRGNVSDATVLLTPPGGQPAAPAELPAAPARGAWQVRVAMPPAAAAPLQATLAVQGIGR